MGHSVCGLSQKNKKYFEKHFVRKICKGFVFTQETFNLWQHYWEKQRTTI